MDIDSDVSSPRPRLVERYRRFLPLTEATPSLTLGEGFTPLVAAPRLGASIGVPNLHLKLEGLNPTGSFKDRGMVVAVSKAIEAGATSIICASTGNTSASAAAYGAAAGIEVAVVLPKGAIAVGKLLQALIAGSKVVAVDGNFDDALRVVRSMTAEAGSRATLVNSVNPHRIAGQKTAAFEICDDLGRAPDVARDPRRERRQHHGLLGRVHRLRDGRDRRDSAADARLPGRGRGADRAWPADREARDDRDGDQDRQSGDLAGRGRGP